MKIQGSEICRVVALVMFAMGAWSRWWGTSDPRGPYYGSFVSGWAIFLYPFDASNLRQYWL